MADDYRELRTRLQAAEAELAAKVMQSTDSPPLLAGVVERTTSAVLELPCFVNVRPFQGGNAEVIEGETSAPEASELDVVPVAFFDRIPVDGDHVIASYQMPQGRWIARRQADDTSDSVIIQPVGCSCFSAPAVLNMTVTYGPGKSSADYFDTVKSAVLTYQPQPSYCIGLDTRYYSPLIPAPGQGGNIFYGMTCRESTGGIYFLGTGTDIFGPSTPFSSFAGSPVSCSSFLILEMLATQTGSPEVAFIFDGGSITIS